MLELGDNESTVHSKKSMPAVANLSKDKDLERVSREAPSLSLNRVTSTRFCPNSYHRMRLLISITIRTNGPTNSFLSLR